MGKLQGSINLERERVPALLEDAADTFGSESVKFH